MIRLYVFLAGMLFCIGMAASTVAGAEDPPAQTITITRTETVRQLQSYQGWSARKWALRTAFWKRRTKALKKTLLARPEVDEAISLACVTYAVSCGLMRSIASCESHFYPRAKNRNSTASGLFQHLYPSTWNTTPYWGFSIWSPYASSFAAAQMLATGRRSEWVC